MACMPGYQQTLRSVNSAGTPADFANTHKPWPKPRRLALDLPHHQTLVDQDLDREVVLMVKLAVMKKDQQRTTIQC